MKYVFRIVGFLGMVALIAEFLGFSLGGDSQYSLSVCVTACTLGSPTSSVGDCNDKGGVRRGYWAKFTDIDWAAMYAAGTSWDGTAQTIKSFIMLSSAVFKPVAHSTKLGEAEAIYSYSDGFYKNTIKTTFFGQSAANRKIFTQAASCCNIVYITVGNNCAMRIFGVDFDGSSLGKILTPLYIDRHQDTSGTLGGNAKARDEVDLAGESLTAPIFLDMLESAIPV